MDNDTVELIRKLEGISQKGPIPVRSRGSNAVGKMLQEELGIKHDTKKKNRLHGYTVSSKSKSRLNLFASVPNWERSKFKSSTEVVKALGKANEAKGYERALFCTVSGRGANTFGLYLKYNAQDSTIEEWLADEHGDQCLLVWDVHVLHSKLTKIGRRALVTATRVDLAGVRAVHFRYVEVMDAPKLEQFTNLISRGAITLDHLISLKFGDNAGREQGPMFKIIPDALELLHGPIKKIDLMDISV